MRQKTWKVGDDVMVHNTDGIVHLSVNFNPTSMITVPLTPAQVDELIRDLQEVRRMIF